MRTTSKELMYKNFSIKIFQDPSPDNPRNWDCFGKMICFHKRYSLGDQDHGLSSSQFDGWRELYDYIEREEKGHIILPLYLYDHSGITISCGQYNHIDPCRWDWGQVGFIYCTKEQVDNEFNGDDEMAIKCLEGEVETYDNYLTGEVYGYEVEFGHKSIDSCWGFYGNDAEEAAKEVIDSHIAYITHKHFKYIKKLIKGKVPIIYRKSLQL